jgi:hypothetical protein
LNIVRLYLAVSWFKVSLSREESSFPVIDIIIGAIVELRMVYGHQFPALL